MGIFRRLCAVAICGLIVLALAGCGGGDDDGSAASAPVETTEAPLTKEELIAQGDAICTEVGAAVRSTSSDPTTQAAEVATLYDGLAERLNDLKPNQKDRLGYEEVARSSVALAQVAEFIQRTGEGENTGAGSVAEAEESLGPALEPFGSASARFGFTQCSKAPTILAPGTAGGEADGEEAAGGIEEEAEEAAPEEEVEVAPEAGGAGVEEESAGGGAGVGGGTEGAGSASGGESSGGIGAG
jgi:hypothetical protein